MQRFGVSCQHSLPLRPKDADPDTLAVMINLEGYAFELVYKD